MNLEFQNNSLTYSLEKMTKDHEELQQIFENKDASSKMLMEKEKKLKL
jgi:hypothetical protein